ncbi:MAG: ABC transporter substrate-binding protein [Acidimicrobiales bacterium]
MTNGRAVRRPRAREVGAAKRVGVVALASACAVSLAACGATAATGKTKSTAKPTTSAVTSKVLTIEGSTNTVLNLNPFNGVLGVDLMYNTLELVNPINGHFSPELATGFTAVSPTTLVFTIRKGVKWSNGTPFTPADVVFTFDMLKKFPALDTGGVWSGLSSVSASGDKVTFNLTKPDVPLGLSLAEVPIVPKAVWSKIANPVKYQNHAPVVTGPYTLGSYAPTKLVLAKNASSFEASQVRPQQVAFVAGSTSQATSDLLVASGAYDFAYAYIPDVQKTFVSRNPAHNVYWFPPGGVVSLYFNLTKAPFTSTAFRQGVSHAINRQAVENKAVFGVEAVAPQTGLILPGEKAWLAPSIPNKGYVTKNDKTALAYFAKAGYTMKGGKLVGSNGKQVSFQIMVPSGYSDWIGAARQISTDLAEVGISATLNEPNPTAYGNATQAGNFEAAMGSFGGSGNAYSAFNPALNSAFAAPIGTSTINNFERFKSAAVDQQLANLASATTTSARLKATYSLEQVMYNKVPFVDLYYGGMWGLFSTRHWVGWPSASNPYTLPATWNDDLLAILLHVRPA